MSSATNPPAGQREITIRYDDREFTGRYTVDGDVITVRLGLDLRTAALGRSRPEDVARVLMYELVREE